MIDYLRRITQQAKANGAKTIQMPVETLEAIIQHVERDDIVAKVMEDQARFIPRWARK